MKDLGITKAELAERVVDKIAEDFLRDDGYSDLIERSVSKRVQKAIDDAVAEVGNAVVDPRVKEMVEAWTIQTTNAYGEKRGKPVSFTEYLVKQAETYMAEPVDFKGSTRAECRDSYSWKASTTRVAYLVNKHLQYGIETAMKQALQSANGKIADGITEAVRMTLTEILTSVKATVTTK